MHSNYFVAFSATEAANMEDELDDIIKEMAHLWPDCRMVKGAPYHSTTNGGVERFNRTIQGKIMIWMRHNNCTTWSIRWTRYK